MSDASHIEHLKKQLEIAQTKIRDLHTDLDRAVKSEKFFMDQSEKFRKELIELRQEFAAFKEKLANDKWDGEFE